jgi:hypothetical protein
MSLEVSSLWKSLCANQFARNAAATRYGEYVHTHR